MNEDSPFLLSDMMAGDDSIAQRSDFLSLTGEDIQSALDLILNRSDINGLQKQMILSNIWKIHYRQKPPTIEEFLTEDWIGPTANSLYPHVKDILVDFWRPDSPHRNLILGTAIGTGKALPESSPVVVDEELTIDIELEDESVLRFGRDDLVWVYTNEDELKEIKAGDLISVEIKDFPVSHNYFLMRLYECQKVKEFAEAFSLSTYKYLIDFFKGFDKDFYRERNIYTEDHHIVPRCEHGSNEKSNLISLPFYFHVKAHYLRGVDTIPDNEKEVLKYVQFVTESLEKVPKKEGLLNEIKSLKLTKSPVFKNNGDLVIGDSVVTPFGKKAIKSIHDQGLRQVHRITLSDGRSFRTDEEHLNTVSFRKIEGVPFWENITTSWIIAHKEEFVFNFPSEEDILGISMENAIHIGKEFSDPDLSLEYESSSNEGVYIKSIEFIGQEITKCISIDHFMGLFYIGDYIITHNTFTSTLWSLYITVHLWSMRDPKRFFGLSQATSLVHAMISFTQSKAQQLLLQPFIQILASSPKFKRVKQEEFLIKHQKDNPDLVCWTSAGKMGALQFYNDIHYVIASDPANLLGLNMITAVLSEISFFLDKGFSSEYIWRIYQDSKARVRSRFENKFFSGTVIDSSPNDIELSPIDKYIFNGQADKDPRNKVITGAQWDFLPHKFPEWVKTGKTFPVFKGSQGEPARMLSPTEVIQYPEDEIYNVPIDVKNLFEENCLKNVKDYCGWPSGSQGTLLREEKVIEKMFTPQLKNIYTYITAPASKSAVNLIWKIIKPKFFVEHQFNCEFYRNPIAKRYMHVDQAEVSDVASISMVHPETNKDGELIFVTDFTIAISPEKGRINLDAIRLFIEDLRTKGGIDFGLITFDQYQSKATIQYLKERKFPVELLSVDRDPKVYLAYISLIQSNRIRAGKNVLLKTI
jgi:hypothetical protein